MPLQTRNRVVNPTHPPRQPPKQKTHEVDDHRQCQHTKKNCPATQESKKSLRVNKPSHNQESRQNRRELTLQSRDHRKNNTPKNCPATQGFKKSSCVNRPSHNQESRQNQRELTLQPRESLVSKKYSPETKTMPRGCSPTQPQPMTLIATTSHNQIINHSHNQPQPATTKEYIISVETDVFRKNTVKDTESHGQHGEGAAAAKGAGCCSPLNKKKLGFPLCLGFWL